MGDYLLPERLSIIKIRKLDPVQTSLPISAIQEKEWNKSLREKYPARVRWRPRSLRRGKGSLRSMMGGEWRCGDKR
jgi:hypothetical protein